MRAPAGLEYIYVHGHIIYRRVRRGQSGADLVRTGGVEQPYKWASWAIDIAALVAEASCMEAMPTAGVSGASPNKADERLLTPAEVAALFRVNPKTVSRWARSGKLHAIRTLGGHRRFRASEVRESLERMAAAS